MNEVGWNPLRTENQQLITGFYLPFIFTSEIGILIVIPTWESKSSQLIGMPPYTAVQGATLTMTAE